MSTLDAIRARVENGQGGDTLTAADRATLLALVDAQSLELQELKAQRRDWLDKDVTARTMVAQERELQAVREALADAEDHIFHHRSERAVEVIRAALKQSRGAT